MGRSERQGKNGYLPLVDTLPPVPAIGRPGNVAMQITNRDSVGVARMDSQYGAMRGPKILIVVYALPGIAAIVAPPDAHGIHVRSQVDHIRVGWSIGDVADVTTREVSHFH